MHNIFLPLASTLCVLATGATADRPVIQPVSSLPQTMIVQTAPTLDTLSDVSARRLNFYVDKIVETVGPLAHAERAADHEAGMHHKRQVQALAQRYLDAASTAGLNKEDTSRYFLLQFARSYRGPVPQLLIDQSGRFTVDVLLFSDQTQKEAPDIDRADYVSILRDIGAHLND